MLRNSELRERRREDSPPDCIKQSRPCAGYFPTKELFYPFHDCFPGAEVQQTITVFVCRLYQTPAKVPIGSRFAVSSISCERSILGGVERAMHQRYRSHSFGYTSRAHRDGRAVRAPCIRIGFSTRFSTYFRSYTFQLGNREAKARNSHGHSATTRPTTPFHHSPTTASAFYRPTILPYLMCA